MWLLIGFIATLVCSIYTGTVIADKLVDWNYNRKHKKNDLPPIPTDPYEIARLRALAELEGVMPTGDPDSLDAVRVVARLNEMENAREANGSMGGAAVQGNYAGLMEPGLMQNIAFQHNIFNPNDQYWTALGAYHYEQQALQNAEAELKNRETLLNYLSNQIFPS